MAKPSDQLAGARDSDSNGGLRPGLLAEERDSARRVLWRIGSWAIAAVGAVIIALVANQSSIGWRREQRAAADLAHQAQQIQDLARTSQDETRRLASAIATLNSDRDRLSSRLVVLEQGLESITGTIAKQNASATASTPTNSKPAPAVAPPQTASAAPSGSEGPPAPQNRGPIPPPGATPVAAAVPPPAAPVMAAAPQETADKPRLEAKSEPNVAIAVTVAAPAGSTAPSAPAPALVSAKSMMDPPDSAAAKIIETPKLAGKDPAVVPVSPEMAAPPPAAREVDAADADPAKSAVQRTQFAVDLGSANSIGGLRALWRGILKSNGELASLLPIIVVRESNTGLGMQLRLAAGPLQDAAAAARLCAALLENERRCETTVFDGQRLAMAADEAPPGSRSPPVIKPMPIKHGSTRQQVRKDDPPKQESTLSSFFGATSSNGTKH